MVETRPWNNIAATTSSVNFGIAGNAEAAMRSDGLVALGFGDGTIDVRNPLNLPGGTGIGGAVFGTAITALTVDSNDNFVIGRSSGHVNVRSAANAGAVPAGFLGDDINFGVSILSLSIVPEPSTAVLGCLGMLLIGLLRRRR